jgi:hypothetical protein
MKRYILIGVGFFLVFAIAFAPAGIIDRALDGVPAVDLVDARGTVWQGSATLIAEGTRQGDVAWQFRFASLFKLQPQYGWTLVNPNADLRGDVAYQGDRAFGIDVEGQLDADLFNPWLARYDIYLTGDFAVQPTSITLAAMDTVRLGTADGQITWSGGLVRYTLSGKLHETTLPPLVAYLEQAPEGPRATVFEEGGQTPLLFAEQIDDRYAKVGMTKRFTKVLQNPWPGSDPDHAIVLEVEEQIF